MWHLTLQLSCVRDVLLVSGIAVVANFAGDINAHCLQLRENFEAELVW